MKLKIFTITLALLVTVPAYGGTVRSSSGAIAHVADSATGPFQCLVSALDGQGYPIRFMGGWRAHGSVRGSLHPAGLALDINQYGRGLTRPRMPSNEVSLAAGCGLISGAQWHNNDSGHFQLGGYEGRHVSRKFTNKRNWDGLTSPNPFSFFGIPPVNFSSAHVHPRIPMRRHRRHLR